MSEKEVGYATAQQTQGGPRQEHHAQLAREIDLLEELLIRVRRLVVRVAEGQEIAEAPDKQAGKNQREKISLSEVLRLGPERIREIRSQIHDGLNELESLLF